MKSKKYSGNKYSNFVLILISLIILSIALLILIYSNIGNGNKLGIKDSSIVGEWKYFASSIDNNFYKEDLNDDQYINLKKDGSASFKITREIKDATWSELRNGASINYGNREINLYKEDNVLIYKKDEKSIYFVKNNENSKYKDEILSKIEDTEKREQNIIVSEIDKKDTKSLNGKWYRFAYENKDGLTEISQDEISENDGLFIDNKKLIENRNGKSTKGTLKFNKEDKIIEVSQDKKDGIILQMDEILVFIKNDESNYYLKDYKDTKLMDEFLDKLKEQKGENNG